MRAQGTLLTGKDDPEETSYLTLSTSIRPLFASIGRVRVQREAGKDQGGGESAEGTLRRGLGDHAPSD